MKLSTRILSILISSRLMAVIVLLFAISIAVATFIENDFGSETARAVVYNSWWFNLLLFIGIINLSLTIILGKLYRKEKRSIFVFHLAFLLILCGAAITRFFGFEGLMHIRTGESSNQIISSDRYLHLSVDNNGITRNSAKKIYLSALSGENHKISLRTGGERVSAELLQVIPNAVESIVPDVHGEPAVVFIISGGSGRQQVALSQSMNRKIGNLLFTINDSLNRDGVNFKTDKDNFHFKAPFDVTVTNMASQTSDTLKGNAYHPLQLRNLYNFNNILAVPQTFLNSGKINLTTTTDKDADQLPEALVLRIKSGNQSETIRYYAAENSMNPPVEIQLNHIKARISYGPRIIRLPFDLRLKEFVLERYPGSESPSSFESRVMLLDKKAGIEKDHRIYMNNILKYQGYRFYQSSYDTDEKGTIFSVNHDYAGTVVTYAGYLMLAIGIVFSLMNRNSRFRKLSAELVKMRTLAPATLVFLMLSLLMPSASAQQFGGDNEINENTAAQFGRLLIQDPGGRIKPVNTLSSEFLRKVSGKTMMFGQNPNQVFLGLMTYPEYWQKVPMIKVGHDGIHELLKTQGPMISFFDVFDLQSGRNIYLLSNYVNTAYQKKPAARSTFDTEIIRLDERINLCFQVYNGNLLRIFPKLNDPTNTWYSPVELTTQFTGSDSVFVNSIVPIFLQSITNKSKTAELIKPEEALAAMHNFQLKYGNEIIPTDFKVDLEIFYNKINLFDRLGSVYGLIGFVLLLLLFITIFAPKVKIRPAIKISTVIIIISFTLHFAGLITRWVISGHAPWSNAYESLIYIAFATVAAGLIFSRKSTMALPATSLLAWLILFVAHLNWMDPQITNLVPVLKSYWLLIHVAIITASYGFLALGAIMALINLIIMIAQTKSNILHTGRMTGELTIVIEMTLIIGLYLLTIGTFLGGVWANESWGRYWGWDPKETWALVSVLVYAFVAHMRLVPGLKGQYIFNLFSLLAFSTIIMTYFGVNYYLSGLHSYAKGDPLPVPVFFYYTVAGVGLIALLAWENQRRLTKNNTNSDKKAQKKAA